MAKKKVSKQVQVKVSPTLELLTVLTNEVEDINTQIAALKETLKKRIAAIKVLEKL